VSRLSAPSSGQGEGRGIWYGLSAYALWGVFPIYFKMIGFISADQIIAHRIIWSFLLLALVRLMPVGTGQRQPVTVTRNAVGLYTAAALLIALNWFVYVWAVTHNFIVETSLGYFITPLVNVLLGVVILGERLRPLQWAAIVLAGAGVAYLTFVYGDVPWIAITLALTFGTYGLVKKKAPLGSVAGLTLETGLLFLPALAFIAVTEVRGDEAFVHLDPARQLLVALSGPITTLPLVLFAAAVQRVPLSTIGILQFIGPTIQFVIGVAVYHEPFSHQQLIGFVFVWAAVVVFCSDGIAATRRRGANAVGYARRA
jgi:chloramphenicol-sensitive protein RarD